MAVACGGGSGLVVLGPRPRSAPRLNKTKILLTLPVRRPTGRLLLCVPGGGGPVPGRGCPAARAGVAPLRCGAFRSGSAGAAPWGSRRPGRGPLPPVRRSTPPGWWWLPLRGAGVGVDGQTVTVTAQPLLFRCPRLLAPRCGVLPSPPALSGPQKQQKTPENRGPFAVCHKGEKNELLLRRKTYIFPPNYTTSPGVSSTTFSLERCL